MSHLLAVAWPLVKTFVQAHELVIYWLVSNAIFSLPTPTADERWYGWVFNVLHSIPNMPRTWNNLRRNGNGIPAIPPPPPPAIP